jgi:hypothetical protein
MTAASSAAELVSSGSSTFSTGLAIVITAQRHEEVERLGQLLGRLVTGQAQTPVMLEQITQDS